MDERPELPETPEKLILVVDDDLHTRTLVKELCEASGFRVALAEDGVEALAKIADEPPDLVLLDLMMPRKDGMGVLESLRESGRLDTLPVILLTAMGDLDGKLKGMELGADDFVAKPFKMIELQTRINAALRANDYRRRSRAAEAELATIRPIDPVTGAGTYSQLKAFLDGELARSRRYGAPTSLLLIGIDDYALLRQTLGREGSDALITAIAHDCRSHLRGADQLFRLDADQFVVVAPETPIGGAQIAARRLHAMITAQPGISTARAGVSIAGAQFPSERVHSSEDLLREAHRVHRLLRDSARPVFDLTSSS